MVRAGARLAVKRAALRRLARPGRRMCRSAGTGGRPPRPVHRGTEATAGRFLPAASPGGMVRLRSGRRGAASGMSDRESHGVLLGPVRPAAICRAHLYGADYPPKRGLRTCVATAEAAAESTEPMRSLSAPGCVMSDNGRRRRTGYPGDVPASRPGQQGCSHGQDRRRADPLRPD